jgi:uncharacterized protein with GYD domain
MPLFITQGRFTREYIKGGLAKPEDRHDAIARLCEQVGGKLVSLYFTLGQYDFIVISEMPDAKAVSMLAFVAAGGGGIEGSVTTQAYTTAEARDIFAAARAAARRRLPSPRSQPCGEGAAPGRGISSTPLRRSGLAPSSFSISYSAGLPTRRESS